MSDEMRKRETVGELVNLVAGLRRCQKLLDSIFLLGHGGALCTSDLVKLLDFQSALSAMALDLDLMTNGETL